MTENDGVLELIEMLYNMISEAWGVPLGNDKCLVDREKALDILEEIKTSLPADLADAKRLVAQKAEYVERAKREGETIRKEAEERARKMMEEQEIVRKAKERAAELIAAAESNCQRLYQAANGYLDDALSATEESISQSLQMGDLEALISAQLVGDSGAVGGFNAGDLGDDQAHAALGALFVVADDVLVGAAVGLSHGYAHSRHDDAVFQAQRTDFARFEQKIIHCAFLTFHNSSLFQGRRLDSCLPLH